MDKRLTPMVKLVKHEEASEAFGCDLFYTDADMHFLTRHGDIDAFIFVPRGYLTDGATVPKVLQTFFPVWDTYYQAAVFHDYLCEYLTIYKREDMSPIKLTRTEVDMYFNELMKYLNTNPVKRKLVYSGVVAYSHFKSIVYPSANMTKRQFENEIREQLKMRDLAIQNQKKIS